ncbi:MAM domain-containing glycosylphosphatidylinositol anchor protein 2-like [Babylonia areolata]|uniref:MAM domain-containing glycosylphosphatidylinositol anchor protein 2-like n=1 Tax=Babylonia areolata TaxID=304850 RepID=UPI003FD37835
MNLWPWLLLSVLGSSSLEVFAQRKSCPALTLKNGRVRIRGGGRMAYFRCKKKFKRVGHKLAVCLSSGTWSQQKPVCVGRGCPDLGALPDVTVKEMYKGGILQFTCPEGMRREGPQTLMCDGTNWDKQPPRCLYGSSLGCDFEDSGLCGWSQDTNDDFDWTWTSGFTPTSDTGPDADHTTGSGHYIFMESSAPQKFGQVTRLISPPYQPPPEPMCVEFYYHMKGPPKKLEVGDLEVMIRSGSREAPVDTVLFHREGYQAEDWVYGMVSIPEQSDVFRIVFAATRRQGWSGDIALDDIRILNCSDVAANTTTTSTTVSTAAIVTTQPTTTTTTTSPPTTTTTTPPPPPPPPPPLPPRAPPRQPPFPRPQPHSLLQRLRQRPQRLPHQRR